VKRNLNYKAVTIWYGLMLCVYMVAPVFSVLVPIYGCNTVNTLPYIDIADLCGYVVKPLNQDPPLILSIVGLISSTMTFLAYVISANNNNESSIHSMRI
jgi:hypothetical protein